VSYSMRRAFGGRLAISVQTCKPLLLLKLPDECDAQYLSTAGVDFGPDLSSGISPRPEKAVQTGLDGVEFVGDFLSG
jgi:hypothetical protein